MNSLALVILAAGEAKRFGAAKQLALIEGKFMLQQVINQCLQIGNTDIFVALGARAEEIQSAIEFGPAKIIYNPHWQNGIGNTISHMTAQLGNRYDGILFVAGDQPLISAKKLQPMLDSWYNAPGLICCAEYAGKPGIPALFPKACYPQLLQLDGDQGAKKILLGTHPEKKLFPLPEAEVDIDRPEDIAALSPL